VDVAQRPAAAVVATFVAVIAPTEVCHSGRRCCPADWWPARQFCCGARRRAQPLISVSRTAREISGTTSWTASARRNLPVGEREGACPSWAGALGFACYRAVRPTSARRQTLRSSSLRPSRRALVLAPCRRREQPHPPLPSGRSAMESCSAGRRRAWRSRTPRSGTPFRALSTVLR
jgi:hypothetical protein